MSPRKGMSPRTCRMHGSHLSHHERARRRPARVAVACRARVSASWHEFQQQQHAVDRRGFIFVFTLPGRRFRSRPRGQGAHSVDPCSFLTRVPGGAGYKMLARAKGGLVRLPRTAMCAFRSMRRVSCNGVAGPAKSCQPAPMRISRLEKAVHIRQRRFRCRGRRSNWMRVLVCCSTVHWYWLRAEREETSLHRRSSQVAMSPRC